MENHCTEHATHDDNDENFFYKKDIQISQNHDS